MSMAKELPDRAVLLDMFTYTPKDGKLRWKKNIAARCIVGGEAGHINHNGYRVVGFNNKNYQSHRIIWKMVHGKDPLFIDHINGNRIDNRLENLRNANLMINRVNTRFEKNKAGLPGVTWFRHSKAWRTKYVTADGKKVTKYFKCKAMAGLCFRKAQRDKMEQLLQEVA